MDELAVLLKSVARATLREVEVNELVRARESDDLLAAVKDSPGIVVSDTMRDGPGPGASALDRVAIVRDSTNVSSGSLVIGRLIPNQIRWQVDPDTV